MSSRKRNTRQGVQPISQPATNASYEAKIISASLGSILTALLVTPLEVVKVRQQSQPQQVTLPSNFPSNVTMCPRGCGTFVLNNGLTECILPRNAVPYFDAATGRLKHTLPVDTGTFSMIRRIFLKEGLQGLYAGLSPTLAMGVPNTVLYFTSYEQLVSVLRTSTDNSLAPAFAGALARFAATVVTAPLELVRTRQAAKIGAAQPNLGMIGESKELVKAGGGFLSLYRGVGPTLGRDCAFSSVYWLVLEKLRDMWRQHNGNIDVSAWQQGWQALCNGSISGMLAAACTTPLDVVKTRRQVESQFERAEAPFCDHRGAVAYAPKSTEQHSVGTFSTMKHIVDTEGIAGLWRGNQARMMKVAPACAVMIASYEIGKRSLTETQLS